MNTCCISLWVLPKLLRKNMSRTAARKPPHSSVSENTCTEDQSQALVKELGENTADDEHLSWAEGKWSYVEVSFSSSVRVSTALTRLTLLLQTTDLPKQSCQTQQIMLCSGTEKMLKQEGAKLVSVLQASVLHLTLTTIITHAGVLVISFCKAKAKNNLTPVWVLKSKHWV